MKQFGAGEPIDLTALVEVETEGGVGTYFIGPRHGGLEIEYKGVEVTVITPQSPLGQQLMGKKSKERWTTTLNGSRMAYRVVSVS